MQNVELKQTFKGHDGPITMLKFSNDFKYIISSSQDSTIRIWLIEKSKEVTTLQGHTNSVNSFAINSNDSMILSGSSDRSIGLWDVKRGEFIQKIQGHTECVNSVCFNENSSIAISGSLDTSAKIWDFRSGSKFPVQVLNESTDSVTCGAAGRYEIFTTSMDGKLRIYDIRNEQLTTYKICDSIVHMELTSEQQAMLITTLDSKIYFLTKRQGQILETYRGYTCKNYMIKSHFAGHEALVISGSETGEVFSWELTEAKVQQRFSFGKGPILDVAVEEPFNSIAVGSSNGDIGIFRKSKY